MYQNRPSKLHQLPFDQGVQIVPPRSLASVPGPIGMLSGVFCINPNDLPLLFITSIPGIFIFPWLSRQFHALAQWRAIDSLLATETTYLSLLTAALVHSSSAKLVTNSEKWPCVCLTQDSLSLLYCIVHLANFATLSHNQGLWNSY